MDNRLRRNEQCVVGMPRCDYVFASTRSCFIGYGFSESRLEVELLLTLLRELAIDPVEAGGGALAPGQNAFCAKICSKIITSQFCVVLLNEETRAGASSANPNVHMEYGLMLGFNKYVVPFQREGQQLPFNVAALDTVKYTSDNFRQKAQAALQIAIAATRPVQTQGDTFDQTMGAFLMTKRAIVSPLDDDGSRGMFSLGSPLGYNLLHDFGGMKFMFFGNFATLRAEAIIWRLSLLRDIIAERRSSLPARVAAHVLTLQQSNALHGVLADLQVWVRVSSDDVKRSVLEGANRVMGLPTLSVFSGTDIDEALMHLDGQE